MVVAAEVVVATGIVAGVVAGIVPLCVQLRVEEASGGGAQRGPRRHEGAPARQRPRPGVAPFFFSNPYPSCCC